ncbi:helix-loop-helix dna-binding domain-containing protein [Ophiostoma piceae UAMH 11346]|uniref:Helix-loop-helix dna-binding domain-containing protein n=1 Tax=Ophiostoma piceae (strain UAMH 11346) TaxID=1262450 RepID=S3D5G0_OPHP1|nr:helix-loop-helix dna-binding domain-containing protein [Ophiostoma piceae UAMH 11346]
MAAQSSPPPQDDPASGEGADDKPRLTEKEKKQNHIASEQKRRQAIREGFDRLTVLVPGLEGQGRSEGLVLKRTVDYMREAIDERNKLISQIEARGGTVDDKYRIQ